MCLKAAENATSERRKREVVRKGGTIVYNIFYCYVVYYLYYYPACLIYDHRPINVKK